MNAIRQIPLSILLIFSLSPLARAAEPFMANGPLNTAAVSNEQILKWSDETVVNLYTYNFTNVDQVIQGGHPYFTDKGFQEFQKATQGSQWLQMIQRKKFDVLPVLEDTGEIIKQGDVQGNYNWTVQIPMVLHLRGPFDMTKQRKTFVITIKRAALAEYPSGIAIDSFEIKDSR